MVFMHEKARRRWRFTRPAISGLAPPCPSLYVCTIVITPTFEVRRHRPLGLVRLVPEPQLLDNYDLIAPFIEISTKVNSTPNFKE